MESLKQLCEEAHLIRNWALLPGVMKELHFPANPLATEPFYKRAVQPQSGLQMTAVMADILPTTSRETLNQNSKLSDSQISDHRNCETQMLVV